METKKEVKYLDMSAHAEVNIEELLERIKSPKHLKKEEKDNDDNN